MPIAPSRSPIESLRNGVRLRLQSSEGATGWWLLRACVVLSLSAAVLAHLPGSMGILLGGAVGVVALLCALRAVALEISLPRWWRISFAAATAGLVLSGSFELGRVLFATWLTLYLVFRRHRIHRRLRSRQRAAVFAGSLLGVVLWSLAPDPTGSGNWFVGFAGNIYWVARFGLILFWLMTALWLVVRARLHFLRLRPKIAVISLLVAEIPILLLLVFAAIAIFGFLGGSRASQGRAVIDQWVESVESGELAGPGPFAEAFGPELGPRPDWGDSLEICIAEAEWDPIPRTLLVVRESELWLALLDPSSEGSRVEAGYRFGQTTLRRLARMLRCEVRVVLEPEEELDLRLRGQRSQPSPDRDGESALWARPESATDSLSTPDLLRRWVPFGAVPMEARVFGPELEARSVLLVLKARPVDLLRELVPRDNSIHGAIAVVLAIVGGVFLLMQMLAVLFGMRIVGGVTSAVGKLHRATEAVARGDLDARIDLPNEDEFGDLADSFNEMTRALEVGQEQALQREVLEREVLMARRIQERLLPSSMPRIPGFEVAASSDPSQQVGGDYFDFLQLGDGRWGFAVGDVTGKGVPAALLMSNVQASLHGQALHPGGVAATVERMNTLLAESTDPHMFVTFFYGVLDPATGEAVCTNAGHEPPILLRADGRVERVRIGGLILGMLPGQSYAEHSLTLEPGDLMVLYTDGVTEATGPGHIGPEDQDDDDSLDESATNFFEEERLLEVVRQSRGLGAEDLRQRILREVRAFTEGRPQSDDITLLVLKRLG